MENKVIHIKINAKSKMKAKLNNHIEYINPKTQSKTAIPTTSVQTIVPDEGFTGLSSVEISAVDSSIDENIIPNNIKAGANILRSEWKCN